MNDYSKFGVRLCTVFRKERIVWWGGIGVFIGELEFELNVEG